MSVSGISSNTFNPYQISPNTNPIQQQFQQLGQALQAGNVSGAQSDFASLQAAFSQSLTGSANSIGSSSTAASPITQAFNQLASDLQSGNVSAAQKDFSTAQQDIQNTQGTLSPGGFHHHHHGGGGSGIETLLQELGQTASSTSSTSAPTTLSAAQQAYSTLQQQLQQYELGGAGTLTSELPISFNA
jgi:hypothetical protein